LWIKGLGPRVVTGEEFEEVMEEVLRVVAAGVRNM
jgi:hypothetical protein